MSFWQNTDFNTFKDFANSCLVPPPNLFTFLLFYSSTSKPSVLFKKKGAQWSYHAPFCLKRLLLCVFGIICLCVSKCVVCVTFSLLQSYATHPVQQNQYYSKNGKICSKRYFSVKKHTFATPETSLHNTLLIVFY